MTMRTLSMPEAPANAPTPAPSPFRVGDVIRPRWGSAVPVLIEGFYRPLAGSHIPPGWWCVARVVESGEGRILRVSAATHERVDI